MVKIKSISRAKDLAEWSHRGRSANINYSIFSIQVQWSQFRQKKEGSHGMLLEMRQRVEKTARS